MDLNILFTLFLSHVATNKYLYFSKLSCTKEVSIIKNNIKLKSILIGIVVLLVTGYLLYFYPIQKYLAEKSFKNYISAQGINEDNIKDKRIFKDYKQDGYIIDVMYQDDSDYIYSYKYFTGKSPFEYNIYCIIYSKQGISIDITGQKAKYPPLK